MTPGAKAEQARAHGGCTFCFLEMTSSISLRSRHLTELHSLLKHPHRSSNPIPPLLQYKYVRPSFHLSTQKSLPCASQPPSPSFLLSSSPSPTRGHTTTTTSSRAVNFSLTLSAPSPTAPTRSRRAESRRALSAAVLRSQRPCDRVVGFRGAVLYLSATLRAYLRPSTSQTARTSPLHRRAWTCSRAIWHASCSLKSPLGHTVREFCLYIFCSWANCNNLISRG